MKIKKKKIKKKRKYFRKLNSCSHWHRINCGVTVSSIYTASVCAQEDLVSCVFWPHFKSENYPVHMNSPTHTSLMCCYLDKTL